MINDVKQFLDRAKLWKLHPDAFAQIDIAISLQRIAEALETANWGGFGRQSALDGPVADELKKAGMIATFHGKSLNPLTTGERSEYLDFIDRYCFGDKTNAASSASPVGENVMEEPGMMISIAQYRQNLANLCDRHKRKALPAPTSSTCARCEEERNAVGDLPPITVSQPATFESLAPTPLTGVPAECWCSAGPSEPVHDPKYGSHVFGERPADKNYGGTD